MQRELKFRRPIYNGDVFITFQKWGIREYNKVEIGKDYVPLHMISRTNEQYIGIQDKNGQDIYKGDIVECEIDNEHQVKKIIGLVRYCDDHVGYVMKNINDPIEEYYFEPEYMTIQVIGNIHQNPELLKGEAENPK